MDFLTQPVSAPPASPPQHAAPRLSSDAPSTSRAAPTDASSVMTSSTTATSEAQHESNAAFAHLRTTTTTTTTGSNGLDANEEPRIELPSTKNGDWRAYGRVEGHVVFWDEGTVRDKKKLKEDQIREAWQVEGTLWFTKRGETFLIVDRNLPPEEVSRTPPKPARRMSFGRRRSISPSQTKNPEVPLAPYPTPAIPHDQTNDPMNGQTGVATSGHDATTPEATEQSSGGAGGFFKKVLDAVRPGRKERRNSSSSAGSEGRSLSRSRSRPEQTSSTVIEPAPSRNVASHGESTPSHPDPSHHLKFEEPAPFSPFPQYKGHPITALYVPSPSHVQSVRFYPQRTLPSSPPSLHDSPLSFLSFVGGGGRDDYPISSPPASPGLSSSTVQAGGVHIQPPVVELDCCAPLTGGTGDGRTKREVTLGLVFKEILCATEAEDFHALVETAMANPDSAEGIPIHRTVSRSLDKANKLKGVGSNSKVDVPPSSSSNAGGAGAGTEPAPRRKSWVFGMA
ncbi:hypothetical protein JCM10212_005475 [Sporobolomyces blumeae]